MLGFKQFPEKKGVTEEIRVKSEKWIGEVITGRERTHTHTLFDALFSKDCRNKSGHTHIIMYTMYRVNPESHLGK